MQAIYTLQKLETFSVQLFDGFSFPKLKVAQILSDQVLNRFQLQIPV